MKKIKSKKASHVGVILSFVIFVTFVFMIFFVLQPRLKVVDKTNSLDYIATELISNVSTDLTAVSVVINKSNPQGCVQLIDLINKTEITDRVIVKNETGSILTTSVSTDGRSLYVQRGNSYLIYVYNAKDFNQAPTGGINPCQQITEGGTGYTLGLSKTEPYVFDTGVAKLWLEYTLKYDILKNYLKANPEDDFGFKFIYNNKSEIKTPVYNLTSINIYVGQTPVQYVNSKATIESGFFETTIW